jgi:CubicO group peptidase (beta-lactamase class C family)
MGTTSSDQFRSFRRRPDDPRYLRSSAVSTIETTGKWLEENLSILAQSHGVPGASVAVSFRGKRIGFATGLLSTATRVEATPESLFQVGSIAKVLTAVLVMQLVEEGLTSLDDPIIRHLPDFRILDTQAGEKVTIRHLLSHTAGFEGEYPADTGKGDECLERLVSEFGTLPQLAAPGRLFSYSNTGYCVLGHLVATLRGRSFDQCLKFGIGRPLDLTTMACDPYEAILHRNAVGHFPSDSAGSSVPSSLWALPRCFAPAGSMLAMSAADLVTFAEIFCRQSDAAGVLSPASLEAMRNRQVGLPYLPSWGNWWGLGVEGFEAASDHTVIGHNGETIGQTSFLRICPEADLCVALMANGGDGLALSRPVLESVFAELEGIALKSWSVPELHPESSSSLAYLGTYASSTVEFTVDVDSEGRSWITRRPLGVMASLGEPITQNELLRLRDQTFVAPGANGTSDRFYAFIEPDGSDVPRYLHDGRAYCRTNEVPTDQERLP